MTNQLRKAQLPRRRNYSSRKHDRMDRSPDDYCRQRKQRAGASISRIHDPGSKRQKIGDRCHGLHASQSASGQVHDAGRDQRPAPGRRRQLSEAHLLLAKCPAPCEVQRDMERSKSSAVSNELRLRRIRNKPLAGTMAVIVQSEAGSPDRSSAQLLLSIRGVAKTFRQECRSQGHFARSC